MSINDIDKYTVNYVVVNYIGPNRSYANYQRKFSEDPLFLARQHLNFLKNCENNITHATFVFNHDLCEDLKIKILDEYKLDNMIVDVVFYDGLGYSYGAWNYVIKRDLLDFDYFVLIEDDYIPTDVDFYKPFISRMDEKTPYVCTLVEVKPDGRDCASSSNSVIRSDSCKAILESYGDVFAELSAQDLPSAWHTQLNFLNHFTAHGFVMRDILDEYSTPHMMNCDINHIVYFGNVDYPALIVPIVIPLN